MTMMMFVERRRRREEKIKGEETKQTKCQQKMKTGKNGVKRKMMATVKSELRNEDVKREIWWG